MQQKIIVAVDRVNARSIMLDATHGWFFKPRMHKEAVEMAAGMHSFMGAGRRFLQARVARAGGSDGRF